MPQLTLLLLGTPRVECNGAPISVDTRKAIALLAYLAVTRQQHSRETLATLFWPDTGDARARLRRTLSVLHQALARGWLSIDRETISLETHTSLAVDIDDFHAHLAACLTHGHPPDAVCAQCLTTLNAAVALYRDDFMAGFTLRDSPAFDDWQAFQTQHLRGELAGALDRLALGHSALGAFEPALAAARRWLTLDPLDEAAHRMVMQVYAWSGQRGAALRHYQECQTLLDDELGVPPATETTALFTQIHDDTLPLPAPTLPPPTLALAVPSAPPAPPRPTLPIPPTPFVGRTHEVAELTHRLTDPACRLLTLTGTGGIGKTRLALQVASQLAHAFPDGVYFVPLAGVESPDWFAGTVANALALTLRTGLSAPDQLRDYLREKMLLLVLDNLEHLRGAAPEIAALLAGAPNIRILVTSRERLRLPGEWVFPVRGLSVPAEGEPGSAEAHGALALFTQRARSLDPAFAPDHAEYHAITQICQLVDGMPLALELAAAWTPVLSCAEIARELLRTFDFLASTAGDYPERHRDLRAIFDYAWDRLPESTRAVFRRLAYFRGTFTRAAAEAIAAATLPDLLALVDGALLQRLPDERFRLHSLVRQYASTRLSAAPEEAEAVAARHAQFYAAQLLHLQSAPQRQACLQALDASIEDVRTAWRWAVAQHQLPLLDTMLAGLYTFYEARCWYQECESVFSATLTELEAAPHLPHARAQRLRARLAARRGASAYRMGEHATSRALLEPALAYARAHGEQAEIAFACSLLGRIALSTGEPAAALPPLTEALTLVTALGDRHGICALRHTLGLAAHKVDDYPTARQHYFASLMLARELNDDGTAALTLNNLGTLNLRLGQYTTARQHFTDSLALAEHSGARYVAGLALNNLGLIAKNAGDYPTARAHYEAALVHLRAIGQRTGIAGVLLNLGQAASLCDDSATADQRYAEALQIFTETDVPEGMALCHFNLGKTAARHGRFAQARPHYEASLALHERLASPFDIADTRVGLGRVLAALGAREAAHTHFLEALHSADAIDALPITLDALVALAEFYVHADEADGTLAVEWLTCAAEHPALDRDLKARVEATRAALAAHLPAASFAAAVARGTHCTLADCVRAAH